MKTNQNFVSKSPLLDGPSICAKRLEIKNYYKMTTATYESLFSCIANEKAYYLRPEPLRHPLIFYYAHTATFFINKLILGKYIDTRINEQFESMFAVGVDEMSWDDLDMTHYQWPQLKEVTEYRRQVKSLVEKVIDTMPIELPINQNSIAWMILMGIEHERIHLETSSVLMRMLPLKDVRLGQTWQPSREYGDGQMSNQLLPVMAGTVLLGRGNDHTIYGWDNEYGSQTIHVDAFKASQFLVSNSEFLSFIENKGYQNLDWWTPEGQQWLNFSKATMPRFWRVKQKSYWQRNLLNEIPLPLNWPVEVNYLEAKAFCNWKSFCDDQYIRLPTEAEWLMLRDRIPTDLSNWHKAPGNINLEHHASSCPVNKFKQDKFYDLIGNVWQWTETLFDALPGFKVYQLYDDFSTPTFDGRHNVIKGGSWISTGNLATKHARYAFRRHFFQHAGFRYVQSQSPKIPDK